MADDISMVFSGGTQNAKQQDSLGGFPSPIPPTDDKNNLFNNVTAQQTTQGWVDYRCIYVFNDNEDINYDASIYIEYLDDVGADVQLGFLLQNEVQSLNFSTIPTGGTFTITIQNLKSTTITWDSDPVILAARIQTAIQTVTDCTVSILNAGAHLYHITFDGILGNKSLSALSITDNNLTPSPINPVVAKITNGSPINTIAPDIGDEKIPPTGILFSASVAPGIFIGTLFSAEGFPVWVKRTVTAGFEAVENDGFNLKIEMTGESV
jgi:hypothetical protein